jgi:hypothetical protein
MKADWKMLSAVVSLRKAAADVVLLCDLAIYKDNAEGREAFAMLPRRIRALHVALQRTQAAFEEGGR